LNTAEIFHSIYQDVFCQSFFNSCYVFLCGGAEKNHVRKKVGALLEKKGFKIFFPEDLFMDLLNRNRSNNLLEFENLLADNSDIVCVICESMGSAVELGAFTQNENIRKKMVAAIEKKYERSQSFINLGPLKLIKTEKRDRVQIYQKDKIEDFCEDLSKTFNTIYKKKHLQFVDFGNFASLITFIPIVIYFYKSYLRKELHAQLKYFIQLYNLASEDYIKKYYNNIFNAVIKYLIKSRTLFVIYTINGDDEFILSPKGFEDVGLVMAKSTCYNKTILHDRIRFAILNRQFNK